MYIELRESGIGEVILHVLDMDVLIYRRTYSAAGLAVAAVELLQSGADPHEWGCDESAQGIAEDAMVIAWGRTESPGIRYVDRSAPRYIASPYSYHGDSSRPRSWSVWDRHSCSWAPDQSAGRRADAESAAASLNNPA